MSIHKQLILLERKLEALETRVAKLEKPKPKPKAKPKSKAT